MIITLCGSARFEEEFKKWNERLTLQGHVVFTLSGYPSYHGGQKDWYKSEQKRILDEVHCKKIDASDAILVLNYDNYIGESTAREIQHAINTGKRIKYAYFTQDPINRACPYAGCSDSMNKRPPCSLCYE